MDTNTQGPKQNKVLIIFSIVLVPILIGLVVYIIYNKNNLTNKQNQTDNSLKKVINLTETLELSKNGTYIYYSPTEKGVLYNFVKDKLDYVDNPQEEFSIRQNSRILCGEIPLEQHYKNNERYTQIDAVDNAVLKVDPNGNPISITDYYNPKEHNLDLNPSINITDAVKKAESFVKSSIDSNKWIYLEGINQINYPGLVISTYSNKLIWKFSEHFGINANTGEIEYDIYPENIFTGGEGSPDKCPEYSDIKFVLY